MKKSFAISFLFLMGVLCVWNLAGAATSFQPRESLMRSPNEAPLSVVADRQIGENVGENVRDEVITDAEANADTANRVSESNISENDVTEDVGAANEMANNADSVYQKDNMMYDDAMNSNNGFNTACDPCAPRCEPCYCYQRCGFHRRRCFNTCGWRNYDYQNTACDPCATVCDNNNYTSYYAPSSTCYCVPRRHFCGWRYRKMMRHARWCNPCYNSYNYGNYGYNNSYSSYSNYGGYGTYTNSSNNNVDALPAANCNCR